LAASSSSAFNKRVALVTGGTRGIGRGIVEALVETKEYQGFLLTYNTNKEAAEAFAEQLKKDKRCRHVKKVVTVGGDLSTEEARDDIFACFDQEFSVKDDWCLACTVHNAGQYVGVTSENAEGMEKTSKVFGDGSLLNDEGKVDFSYMRYYQKLYGEAYIDLCERSLARMREARERFEEGNFQGSLIGISSPGCNAAFRLTPGYDMPGSGKCVMEYANRLFALRAAPLGINCNVIIPGVTRSDAWGKISKQRGLERDEYLEQFMPNIPMNEVIETKEIGDVVAFLSGSGGGRFMTGLSLRVDGGLHLK
jgi:NAD(P)-dependent dehydrogenase (short-subunit alcohol dehydrogenase family)